MSLVKRPLGFLRRGAYRSQFLREAVADLRQNLRRLGSDLVIRQGKPEEVIPKLVRELRIDWVICEEEVTTEERRVEDAVQMQLGGVPLKKEWGMTLYHPSQLPFSIAELPDVFTRFRKAVEKSAEVRPPLPPLREMSPLPEVAVGELPTWEELGVEPPLLDERGVLRFRGG